MDFGALISVFRHIVTGGLGAPLNFVPQVSALLSPHQPQPRWSDLPCMEGWDWEQSWNLGRTTESAGTF